MLQPTRQGRPHGSLTLLALLSLAPTVFAGDRQFTITNKCPYTIWPAISNYLKPIYTGPGGWEAKPGTSKTVTVPSPANVRVWPRRGCTFDASGMGKCVTGDCAGKLECGLGSIGWVNVVEINLDSWAGKDFWDTSSVPGWTAPIAVEPDGCPSLACTKDANAACPDDRMKQKDSNGNVIGCLSACMAGINAQDPSYNCCSGIYNSVQACDATKVDFYKVLKPLCEHAYWYPYDNNAAFPKVDFPCPAADSPGYKITFCPDSSNHASDLGPDQQTAGGSTPTGNAVPASSPKTLLLADATQAPASSTGSSARTKAASTGSSARSADPSAASGTASAVATAATSDPEPSAGATSGSSDGLTSAASPDVASPTSAPTDTASPATTSSSDKTILGLSQPLFIALTAAAVLFLLLAIVLVFRRSRSSQAQAASLAKTPQRQYQSGSEESEMEKTTDESESEDERGGGVRARLPAGSAARASGRQPLLAR
ncbi:RHTO0S06e02784g1_1 [Rhodotorula toruloides]|uniref:RHTO0S06e02784g1_1 n=1 Tax=Rhodotorula toruloides TaxID=5286 RepID=A0A061AVG4_RHOTO|nr:RHTO0S06e02784g1_1 [Rhodotorula toruloides]